MFIDNSFGVYVDSDTARFHFDQLCRVNEKIKFRSDHYCRNVDDFLSKKYVGAIAGFHVPFPEDTDWLIRLAQVYDVCDHIFVFCSELHELVVEQLSTLDRPNISLYLCGSINHNFTHTKVYHWMDWIHTTTEFYARDNPGFLEARLHPYSNKPSAFDILLGNQRPHRDFAYNYINQHKLADQVIMTYIRYANLSLIENDKFILETEGVEYYPERNYRHSVDRVRYYGLDMSLSQLVPIEIYNRTAYSLVAETNAFNHFNFCTEKIVKPLMARRLFVVLAGRHYLKNLQSMGFQTFNSIIDESYDSIEDNDIRWQRAMEQVDYLIKQDQQQVLEKIRPIVEHNHKLIMEKNWYLEFITALESEIWPLLNNAKVCPTSTT